MTSVSLSSKGQNVLIVDAVQESAATLQLVHVVC